MAKAKVQPIPKGFHTLTPQLSLEGAAEAIELFKRAFGAEEITRAPDPSGNKVWHAHLMIGNSAIFVNDVFPEMGGTAKSAGIWMYLEDADKAFKRAVDAGMKAVMAPTDMFWGDRFARVTDRWGNDWGMATHTQDMTPEEMKKAEQAAVVAMKK
jgi:PhnB protein